MGNQRRVAACEPQALGSGIITALEEAWRAIQHAHPELPPAVLITGAGSQGSTRGLRLGHFAASRWQLADHATLSEIFVGGEGLARGASDVLATLLHEAAHALAHRRHIQDTSRQGRYHNRKFKALAEELGLHIDHDPRIGWSLTTLPEYTAQRYTNVLERLERALTAHRAGERTTSSPTASGRNLVACLCDCGRRLRIAPATLELGPINCGRCHTPFRPDTEHRVGETLPGEAHQIAARVTWR